MMNYKGFIGSVEYDDEARIFSGEVINTRSVITFQGTSVDEIEKDIVARDYKDSHRKISPLKKADDAIEIDTTNMSIDQVVEAILAQIKKTQKIF